MKRIKKHISYSDYQELIEKQVILKTKECYFVLVFIIIFFVYNIYMFIDMDTLSMVSELKKQTDDTAIQYAPLWLQMIPIASEIIMILYALICMHINKKFVNEEKIIENYGKGFKILGEYQGWHYGIWEKCMPAEFVFVKAINEQDFIFCSMLPDNFNQFCGVLKEKWTRCIDGEIQSIDEEEAKMLLETKLNRYEHVPEVHIGDVILVKEPSNGEYIKSCIKAIDYMSSSIQIGYENSYSSGYVEMDEYEETWKLPE